MVTGGPGFLIRCYRGSKEELPVDRQQTVSLYGACTGDYGRKALAASKNKVRELFHELIGD
jgi:hypothetical protein